jgi:hypothetical protein
MIDDDTSADSAARSAAASTTISSPNLLSIEDDGALFDFK